MSRLATQARFEDPIEPAAVDLTGRTAWVYLDSIEILDGLCTCRELRVEVLGEGLDYYESGDQYELGAVQWEPTPGRWRELRNYCPTEALIIRAALAAVKPERAIEALMEAE
jgi:hypothetical protein